MSHLATFLAFTLGCCIGQFICWRMYKQKFDITTLALVTGSGATLFFHYLSNAT